MDRAFHGRRSRKGPAINITSLIDVMFLLLIFLLVSTTFRQHWGIDITLPAAETATEQKQQPLEVTVSASGVFLLGRNPVDEEGLRAGINEAIRIDPAASVVLRADESADFSRVIRAIDIARDVGVTRLIIPTRFGETPR